MPSINSNFGVYNISGSPDDIDYNNDLNYVDDNFDVDDDYEINNNVHDVHINTIHQLQAMGIETNAIDPDILEDALLSVVSLPINYLATFNSINV